MRRCAGALRASVWSISRAGALFEYSAVYLAPLILLVFSGLSDCAAPASAMDLEKAVRLARRFLETDDAEQRVRLARKLSRYTGDIDRVLLELQTREYDPVEPGYHEEESFTVPELAEAYPDDLLYFTVPESYQPDRPTGLIVFLHGGGRTTTRRAPCYSMDFPEDGDDESTQLGDVFAASGMIAVGPSAPWNEDSYWRWCTEEADDYLAAVIRECKSRFNIDADRVFLLGHSMGGFGAYHHVQRQPDRFAGVVANAGSWTQAYWPATLGTRLCIVHGVRDAREGQRWHHTDIEYARRTHWLLDKADIEHDYYEHDGEHSICYGKPYIAQFFESAAKLRRDPYAKHVVLASPVGFRRSHATAVRDNRWLSLDEATEGTLVYDVLRCDEDVEFDEWELEYVRRERPGAAIEAKNLGNNTIDLTTHNVARLTVWLHPQMVDVSRPVTLRVDGQVQFRGPVTSSLLTALDSYRRRGDWGLIYPIRVEVACPAAAKDE